MKKISQKEQNMTPNQNIKNKDLKRRIIEISYKNKLSHLGSCLTAVDIIDEIYSVKKPDEKFVLSSGHAGLALYVVIENYLDLPVPKERKYLNAEQIFKHHGVHPDRCKECRLDCSSGSLGQGLPIAVGMALADRSKNVYCLVSDGECSEGSIWEALRIRRELKLENLTVYINWNGWAAYKETDDRVRFSLSPHCEVKSTNVDDFSFLKGQDAHYHVLDENDYKQAMEILK